MGPDHDSGLERRPEGHDASSLPEDEDSRANFLGSGFTICKDVTEMRAQFINAGVVECVEMALLIMDLGE